MLILSILVFQTTTAATLPPPPATETSPLRHIQQYSDISDTESPTFDQQSQHHQRNPMPHQQQQQGAMGTLDHNVLSQMFDNVNNNLKAQGSTTVAMDPSKTAAAAVASKLFPQGSSSRKPGCDNFTDLVSQLSNILAKKKNRAKVTIKQVVGGHVMAQTVLEKDKLKPVTCKTTLGSPRSIDTAYGTDDTSPGSQQPKSGIPPKKPSVCTFMWKPGKKTNDRPQQQSQAHASSPMLPPISTPRQTMNKGWASSCGDSNYGSEDTFTSPGTDFSSPSANPASPGYGYMQKPTNKYAPIVNTDGGQNNNQEVDLWKQMATTEADRFPTVDPNDILSMPSPTSSVCSVTSSVLEREPLLPIGDMLRHLEMKSNKPNEFPGKIERKNPSAAGARLFHKSGAGKGKPSAYARHKELYNDFKDSLKNKRGRRKKSESNSLQLTTVSRKNSPYKFSGYFGRKGQSRSRSRSNEGEPKKRGRPKGSKNKATLLKLQQAEEEKAALEAEIAWRTSLNQDSSEMEAALAATNEILEKAKKGRSTRPPSRKVITSSGERTALPGPKKRKGKPGRPRKNPEKYDAEEDDFFQDTNMQSVDTEHDTSLAAELLSSCLQYNNSTTAGETANKETAPTGNERDTNKTPSNDGETTFNFDKSKEQNSSGIDNDNHVNSEEDEDDIDTDAMIEQHTSPISRPINPVVKSSQYAIKQSQGNKLKIKKKGTFKSPFDSADESNDDEEEAYSSAHSQYSDDQDGNESDIPDHPVDSSTPDQNKSEEKQLDKANKRKAGRDIRDRSFTDIFNLPPPSPDDASHEDPLNVSNKTNDDDALSFDVENVPDKKIDSAARKTREKRHKAIEDQSSGKNHDAQPIANQEHKPSDDVVGDADATRDETENDFPPIENDVDEFTAAESNILVHEEVVETTGNIPSNRSTRENTPDNSAMQSGAPSKESVPKLRRDDTVKIAEKDEDAIPEELELQDNNKDASAEEMYGDSEPERERARERRHKHKKRRATPSLANMVSAFLDTEFVETEEEPGHDRKLRSSSLTSSDESASPSKKDDDTFAHPAVSVKGSPRKSPRASRRTLCDVQPLPGRDSSQDSEVCDITATARARDSSSEQRPEVSHASRSRKKKKRKSASTLLRNEESQSASSGETSVDENQEKSLTVTAEVHPRRSARQLSNSSRESSIDSDTSIRRSPRLRSPSVMFNSHEWELSPATEALFNSPRGRIPKVVLNRKYAPVSSPPSWRSPRVPGSSLRRDVNIAHPIASPRPIRNDTQVKPQIYSRDSSLDAGASPRYKSPRNRTESPQESPASPERSARTLRPRSPQKPMNPSGKMHITKAYQGEGYREGSAPEDMRGEETVGEASHDVFASTQHTEEYNEIPSSPRSSSPEPEQDEAGNKTVEKVDYLKIGTQNKALKVKLNAGAQALFANGLDDLNPSVVLTDLRYSLGMKKNQPFGRQHQDQESSEEEGSDQDKEVSSMQTSETLFKEPTIETRTKNRNEGRHRTKAERKIPLRKPHESKKESSEHLKRVSFIPEDVSNFYSPEYNLFSPPSSNAPFMSPPNPFESPSYSSPPTSASPAHVYSAVNMDMESTSSEDTQADGASAASGKGRGNSASDLPTLERSKQIQDEEEEQESTAVTRNNDNAEQKRVAELMEQLKSCKVSLVSKFNELQKILSKSGTDRGKQKESRKRPKTPTNEPSTSQESDISSGGSTPDILKELINDHNKIKNLLETNQVLNEVATAAQETDSTSTENDNEPDYHVQEHNGESEQVDEEGEETSYPEETTEQVLPWTQTDLVNTPAHSNQIDDIPPFFSPLQTRSARRKNYGIEPPPKKPNATSSFSSTPAKPANAADRGRNTQKQNTPPKGKSRSKSATRSRARSRSRSRSRSKSASRQSETTARDRSRSQGSRSRSVPRQRSTSPALASKKRARSKSSTREVNEGPELSPAAKRRRSRSSTRQEVRERSPSPIQRRETRSRSGGRNQGIAASRSRSKSKGREPLQNVTGYEISEMPRSPYSSSEISSQRSPSPKMRQSKTPRSRSKSVPRKTNPSPQSSSAKNTRCKEGRFVGTARETGNRSQSRSPPRTRESVSRARTSSTRPKSREHSASRSRSRSTARRTRDQSRSPSRGAMDATRNEYKRSRSVPRDVTMRVYSRITSPSADESSDDEPLLRPRIPGARTGRSHPNVRQVPDEAKDLQGRQSRQRHKSRPGQECSVVIHALTPKEIERSMKGGPKNRTYGPIRTPLLQESITRDSSQTTFYSDSSVSPPRRTTKSQKHRQSSMSSDRSVSASRKQTGSDAGKESKNHPVAGSDSSSALDAQTSTDLADENVPFSNDLPIDNFEVPPEKIETVAAKSKTKRRTFEARMNMLAQEALLYQSFPSGSRDSSRSSDRGHSPRQGHSRSVRSPRSDSASVEKGFSQPSAPRAEKVKEPQKAPEKKVRGSEKPSVFEQFEKMTAEYKKTNPTETKRSRRKSMPSKSAGMSPATEARSIEELQSEWMMNTPETGKPDSKTAEKETTGNPGLFSPFKALGLDNTSRSRSRERKPVKASVKKITAQAKESLASASSLPKNDFSDNELPDLVTPKPKHTWKSKAARKDGTSSSSSSSSSASVGSHDNSVPKYQVQNPLSTNAKQFLKKSILGDKVNPPRKIDEDNWLSSNVIRTMDQEDTKEKSENKIGPGVKKPRQKPIEKTRQTTGLKSTKEPPKISSEVSKKVKPKVESKFMKKVIKTEPPEKSKIFRLKTMVVGPNNEMHADVRPIADRMFNIRIRVERVPYIDEMAMEYKAREIRKQKRKTLSAQRPTAVKNKPTAKLPRIPKIPKLSPQEANTRKRHPSQGAMTSAKHMRLDDMNPCSPISPHEQQSKGKYFAKKPSHPRFPQQNWVFHESSDEWNVDGFWPEGGDDDDDDFDTAGSLQARLNQPRGRHHPPRHNRAMDFFSPPPSPPHTSTYSRFNTGATNRNSSRLVYQSPRAEDADADGVSHLQIVNVMGGYQEQYAAAPAQQPSSNKQVIVGHGTQTFSASLEDALVFNPTSPDAYKLPHIVKETSVDPAYFNNMDSTGEQHGTTSVEVSAIVEESDHDSERLIIDDEEIDIEGFSEDETSETLLITKKSIVSMGMMTSQVEEEELDSFD